MLKKVIIVKKKSKSSKTKFKILTKIGKVKKVKKKGISVEIPKEIGNLSLCENILKDNNRPEAVVTIILSNDSKLRKLKKEYFNKDVLTDTISFNLEATPLDNESNVKY